MGCMLKRDAGENRFTIMTEKEQAIAVSRAFANDDWYILGVQIFCADVPESTERAQNEAGGPGRTGEAYFSIAVSPRKAAGFTFYSAAGRIIFESAGSMTESQCVNAIAEIRQLAGKLREKNLTRSEILDSETLG